MSNIIKILSFGRVGAMAINNYLNAHPDLSVPAWNILSDNIDKSINHKQAPDISSLFDENCSQRAAMIHHSSFFPTENSSAKQFIEKQSSNKILHLVRNPFEQALSWLNFINAGSITSTVKNYKPSANVKDMLLSNPKILDSLKLGLACEAYYHSDSDVKVVNFNDLDPNSAPQTMTDIFSWLGLAPFSSVIFEQLQNSTLNNVMSEGVDYEFNSEILNFAIIRKTDHEIKYSTDEIKIFNQFSGSELVKFKLLEEIHDEDLYLVFSKSQRSKISSDFEKHLSTEQQHLAINIVTKWAKRAQSKIKLASRLIADSLSEQDVDYLSQVLKEDLALFYQYHPQYQDIWQINK